MKKFIIACTAVIIAVICWMFVSDRIGSTLSFNMNKEVKTFTTVSDKEILVDTGNGMEPFEIRGVNMGVGIPGHFATDYAIDKETYLRWFRMIKDMGANCVRVYTLLQDDFYDAVWEFNHDNPDPLYIIHGVWIDDYVLYSHRDAYSKDFLNEFLKDSRILVDMIHGNKRFSLGEDLGSGSYTKDISPWVLGYILGVEWEDTTVAFTDHMQEERDSYEGKYMRTTEEATPFEAMLAQVGDKIIEYETEKYSSQRLIAFSNWPTTDPLEWDQIVEWYFRKFEQVDVEHIKTTDEFLSGQFASYHIYPYFPDYLGFMDVLGMKIESREKFTDEDGTFNSYRAYLTAINAHHTMPVIISEYGVPSSRGRAQSDRNTGRSQGGMSEEEQGKALVQCYKDIMASGCAGSVAFTWQDEWFKRTWNTMAYTDLTKTCYWSDYQTNEQYFGILSFDPGEVESVCYVDGDVSEWEETDIVMETDTMSLSCKYDEKYVYFRVHKDDFHFGNETLYEQVEKSLKGGVTFVQLREKKLDEESFLQEAIEIKELCKKYNVPFVINDNVDIAIKMDADGVHVGQSDMEAGDVRKKLGPDKIIGVSAQTVEQAILAEKHGADYLGVGAVFPTGSKDDAEDVPFETLKAICEAVSIPVIAIGGITKDNVKELAGSGICGIAVISAIFASKDIEAATKELKVNTIKAVK